MVNKSIPIQSDIDSVNSGNVQSETEYQDAEVAYKGSVPSYVEKVMVSTNAEDDTIFKLLLRQNRVPEVGDKFSSRHGQKGVIGMIILYMVWFYVIYILYV